jgi:C-terminal processing protease CtpA/Prc
MTLPDDDDGPRHLRHRGEHFWSEVVGDALYIGYNQVQAGTASGETISGLARDVEAAVGEGDVTRVIVDIRGNPGGDNFTYPPLRDALIRLAEAAPGSVVVLTGRSTFSAAGNFATELRAAPGIRFIGEPTGAAPNLWGDADVVTLPFSKLVVHVATRVWIFAPDDDALAIEPDVRVPVRWADYAAGVDAALDAALAE